jgi:SsrA-binding protein
MHVSPYEKGNIFNRDPVRPEVLMHKREILKLNARVTQDGMALIPLSLYFKDSRVRWRSACARAKSSMTSGTRRLSKAPTRNGQNTERRI